MREKMILGSLVLSTVGCGSFYRPCSEGVLDLIHEQDAFAGTIVRKCQMIKVENGRLLNHGEYLGYDASEHVKVQGFYDHGLKTGKWQFFQNGQLSNVLFFHKGYPTEGLVRE